MAMPVELKQDISKVVKAALPQDVAAFVLERINIAPNDLLLGGHVQGVVRQRIVVSAGLIVGLLNNDERAFAILAHEIAHMKHLDKFLPGIIVLSLLNIAYFVVILGKAGVLYAMLPLAMTKYVTHRREYAADAHAVGLLGSKRMFARTLLSLNTDEEAFSHPTREQRIEAMKRNLPILNPSIFWGVFWLINIIGGILLPYVVYLSAVLSQQGRGLPVTGWWASVLTPQPQHWAFGFAMVCIGLIGISVEISKVRWL